MPINKELTAEQYRVMFRDGTESQYSGIYYKHCHTGEYLCLNCNVSLVQSTDKRDTNTGWAEFNKIHKDTLQEVPHTKRGYKELFLYCTGCKAHIGHKIKSGFFLNSNALLFKPSLGEA